jgi:hypothetical protein
MTRLPPLHRRRGPQRHKRRDPLGGGDDIDRVVVQTGLCARSRTQYGIRALIAFDNLRFRHETIQGQRRSRVMGSVACERRNAVVAWVFPRHEVEAVAPRVCVRQELSSAVENLTEPRVPLGKERGQFPITGPTEALDVGEITATSFRRVERCTPYGVVVSSVATRSRVAPTPRRSSALRASHTAARSRSSLMWTSRPDCDAMGTPSR